MKQVQFSAGTAGGKSSQTPRLQDDFYEAINADWLKTAKIPADRPATGGFQVLVENIEKTLMTDFAAMEAGDKKPDNSLLIEFLKYYQLAADFKQRDAAGAKPLQPYLKRLANIKSLADWQAQLKDWLLAGLPAPFDLDVDADMKNTKVNALFADAPGLFLPDKTYYAKDNQNGPQLMAVFKQMMQQLLTKVGYSKPDAQQILSQAIAFDAQLVSHVKSAEEAADYSKMYNPQSFAEFTSHSKEIDFASLIPALIGAKPEKIIVTQPKFFAAFDQLVTAENFPQLKSWLIVNIVRGLTGYLSNDLRITSGSYGRALSGSKEAMSQQKSAYYLAAGQFDQVVGDYYGRRYFGPKAKQDVHNMVVKMIAVYKKRLQQNDWLSANTRKQAIVKLEHLGIQVGYPDQIKPLFKQFKVDSNASLLVNALHFAHLTIVDRFSKWNQPVVRTEWEMSANTVNAYYHPFRNIIVFPAAILQAPFYSLKQSASANFGGIGAVIAHEVSHAFDNNGALFDEFGNLHNWWTESDTAHFKKLAQTMVTEFNGLPFAGSQVNGKLTVSENIADAGGLSCALEAAKSEKDVDLKAFFTNWAKIWRTKAQPEYLKLLLAIDVHAPAKLRANVQVQNLTDFYTTFNVKPGDKMYLAPEKRVNIW
ncbi:M13 family metallopeptidase [Loigolactobacillus rennini]|uniref:Endopeptidase PepO n=1 Tax=Loigolactobacillus rennini DSM 20253 TaxID=1423796 RepID=A0A0R2D6C7_9LACO|nr:M13-type metalloendopeptidase [Loigolactobacillus rennini]KRM96153.1 endopeptidase PepO [Loigolactobacillus rennini DSM 20253]